MSLVTGLFFLVLLLNQRWSQLLRLQASHCSTFRIMCDVPSIAVFCSESIECFPGTVSKFFFKLLVTIPVALIITGTIVHFRFHIRCISIHRLLYLNFFSASFCTIFLSAGTATSISVRVFSFLFLIIISGVFAVTSLFIIIIIIIIIGIKFEWVCRTTRLVSGFVPVASFWKGRWRFLRSSVQAWKQNIGGHIISDDRELESVVTRWLVAQDGC